MRTHSPAPKRRLVQISATALLAVSLVARPAGATSEDVEKDRGPVQVLSGLAALAAAGGMIWQAVAPDAPIHVPPDVAAMVVTFGTQWGLASLTRSHRMQKLHKVLALGATALTALSLHQTPGQVTTLGDFGRITFFNGAGAVLMTAFKTSHVRKLRDKPPPSETIGQRWARRFRLGKRR